MLTGSVRWLSLYLRGVARRRRRHRGVGLAGRTCMCTHHICMLRMRMRYAPVTVNLLLNTNGQSEYERARLQRIAANRRIVEAMGGLAP